MAVVGGFVGPLSEPLVREERAENVLDEELEDLEEPEELKRPSWHEQAVGTTECYHVERLGAMLRLERETKTVAVQAGRARETLRQRPEPGLGTCPGRKTHVRGTRPDWSTFIYQVGGAIVM